MTLASASPRPCRLYVVPPTERQWQPTMPLQQHGAGSWESMARRDEQRGEQRGAQEAMPARRAAGLLLLLGALLGGWTWQADAPQVRAATGGLLAMLAVGCCGGRVPSCGAGCWVLRA